VKRVISLRDEAYVGFVKISRVPPVIKDMEDLPSDVMTNNVPIGVIKPGW
jgi:hypothetical protein